MRWKKLTRAIVGRRVSAARTPQPVANPGTGKTVWPRNRSIGGARFFKPLSLWELRHTLYR